MFNFDLVMVMYKLLNILILNYWYAKAVVLKFTATDYLVDIRLPCFSKYQQFLFLCLLNREGWYLGYKLEG